MLNEELTDLEIVQPSIEEQEPVKFQKGKIKAQTVNDIVKSLNSNTEFMSIERGDINLVMIFDHKALIEKKERRIKKVYHLQKDGQTVVKIDVDTVIKILVQKVKKEVNVEELLVEVFTKTPPDTLLEMYKRLTQPKPTPVKAGSGTNGSYSHCCYSLIIPGSGKEKQLEIVINK
jgi:hypothetical protein